MIRWFKTYDNNNQKKKAMDFRRENGNDYTLFNFLPHV